MILALGGGNIRQLFVEGFNFSFGIFPSKADAQFFFHMF